MFLIKYSKVQVARNLHTHLKTSQQNKKKHNSFLKIYLTMMLFKTPHKLDLMRCNVKLIESCNNKIVFINK